MWPCGHVYYGHVVVCGTMAMWSFDACMEWFHGSHVVVVNTGHSAHAQSHAHAQAHAHTYTHTTAIAADAAANLDVAAG